MKLLKGRFAKVPTSKNRPPVHRGRNFGGRAIGNGEADWAKNWHVNSGLNDGLDIPIFKNSAHPNGHKTKSRNLRIEFEREC